MTTERYLREDALLAFDSDFRDWKKYREFIQQLISRDAALSILDVGGGNGGFMDHLLDVFPAAKGCVLDYASSMLLKNKLNSRKSVKQGSATELEKLFPDGRFDLITLNMLLHHLVGGDDEATSANVLDCLRQARGLLSTGGRVIVYEQVYDPALPLLEPGRLIYLLTSIQTPWIARPLRLLGANTAGVGVRFRSREGWRSLFDAAGYHVESEGFILQDGPSLLRRTSLNIGRVGSFIYSLR